MEFKTQQNALALENEVREFKFKTIEYFTILMVQDSRTVLGNLNSKYFSVKEMLRNKWLTKENFIAKLEDMAYIIKYTRKIIKILALIQDQIIYFTPILSFSKYDTQIKECYFIFNRVRDEFKKVSQEILEKGMTFFIAFFVREGNTKHHVEYVNRLKKLLNLLDGMHPYLTNIVKYIRNASPRLYFLSE